MSALIQDLPSVPGPVDTELGRDEKVEQRRQREHEKIIARRERRATYDLLPELREAISALSANLRIPASQLVNLALMRFLMDYREGRVDLGLYKKPSHSPRYDWNLDLSDLLTKLKLKKSLKSLK